MAKLLTKEFYEHLHKLDDQGTIQKPWHLTVSDENDDLKWCTTYIKDHVMDEDDTFIDEVRAQLEMGTDSLRKLEKIFHMDHRTFRAKLRKCEIEDEVLAALRFWNGFVVYRFDTGNMYFASTVKHCSRLTGSLSPHALSTRLMRGKNYWGDLSVHKVRDWKLIYPNFQIDRKELLNSDIIKLAS